MTDFGTYAKFYTAEEAAPLLELLTKENIPYQFLKEKNHLDAVIVGDGMFKGNKVRNMVLMLFIKKPTNDFYRSIYQELDVTGSLSEKQFQCIKTDFSKYCKKKV